MKLRMDYKCPKCRNCESCRNPYDTERISQRKEVEDEAIKDSVLLAGLLDAIAKDEDIKNNSEENPNENEQSVRVDKNENVKEENLNKDAKNEEYECECEDALICLCSSSTSIADSNGLSDSVNYEWDDEFTALSNVSGNKEYRCEPADEIEVTFAKLNSCEIMRPFNNGLVDTNQNELPFNSLYTAGIITEDQYEQDTSTTTLQKVTGYDLDTFYNERNSAMGCSLPSHVATVFMMDHTNHGPNVAAHNDDFDWDLYYGPSASEHMELPVDVDEEPPYKIRGATEGEMPEPEILGAADEELHGDAEDEKPEPEILGADDEELHSDAEDKMLESENPVKSTLFKEDFYDKENEEWQQFKEVKEESNDDEIVKIDDEEINNEKCECEINRLLLCLCDEWNGVLGQSKSSALIAEGKVAGIGLSKHDAIVSILAALEQYNVQLRYMPVEVRGGEPTDSNLEQFIKELLPYNKLYKDGLEISTAKFAEMCDLEILRTRGDNGEADTEQNMDQFPPSFLYTEVDIKQYEQEPSSTSLHNTTGYEISKPCSKRNSDMGSLFKSVHSPQPYQDKTLVATEFMAAHHPSYTGPSVAPANVNSTLPKQKMSNIPFKLNMLPRVTDLSDDDNYGAAIAASTNLGEPMSYANQNLSEELDYKMSDAFLEFLPSDNTAEPRCKAYSENGPMFDTAKPRCKADTEDVPELRYYNEGTVAETNGYEPLNLMDTGQPHTDPMMSGLYMLQLITFLLTAQADIDLTSAIPLYERRYKESDTRMSHGYNSLLNIVGPDTVSKADTKVDLELRIAQVSFRSVLLPPALLLPRTDAAFTGLSQ